MFLKVLRVGPPQFCYEEVLRSYPQKECLPHIYKIDFYRRLRESTHSAPFNATIITYHNYSFITLRWDHNQSKCLWSQINADQFQPRQSPGAGSSSLWLSHDSTEWVDAAVMLKIKGWWDCSKIWVSLISQWTLLPTKWCNGETWVEINQHLMQISFFLFLILKDVCAFWHGMHHS